MCTGCQRMVQEVRERQINGRPSVAQEHFEDACRERGLDPDAMPRAAEEVAVALNIAIARAGTVLAHEPGLMSWYAAALDGMARTADWHAERVFEAVQRRVFGPDGPGCNDDPPHFAKE